MAHSFFTGLPRADPPNESTFLLYDKARMKHSDQAHTSKSTFHTRSPIFYNTITFFLRGAIETPGRSTWPAGNNTVLPSARPDFSLPDLSWSQENWPCNEGPCRRRRPRKLEPDVRLCSAVRALFWLPARLGLCRAGRR